MVAPVPAEPTTTTWLPQLVAARAEVELSPVGFGKANLDQLAPSGEVHTVALVRPVGKDLVPAISQFPLAPGGTTAERVDVVPPPMSGPASVAQL